MPGTDFVRSLFVKLRKPLKGVPWWGKEACYCLGLRNFNHFRWVEKPNNRNIRGILKKVPHLVYIQTDRMFYLNHMRRYYEQLCRPPISVDHQPTKTHVKRPRHMTNFGQHLLYEHQLPMQLEGFAENWVPKQPSKQKLDAMWERRRQILSQYSPYSQKAREANALYVDLKDFRNRAKQVRRTHLTELAEAGIQSPPALPAPSPGTKVEKLASG